MRFKVFQFLIVLAFFSCTNEESRPGTDAFYADYTITAEEGAENVTCLLKFYEDSRNGVPTQLEPPAAVLLDGVPVPGDSAGLSGAYYEIQKPLAQFAGTHTLTFKNAEGREYAETFTFQPFSLNTELGDRVPRGDLAIEIEGVPTGQPLRVLVVDTSFTTPDINDMETVQNGQLVITEAALRNVASGPVTLYLFKEEERPLEAVPGAGGRLSITYGLTREFELVDE